MVDTWEDRIAGTTITVARRMNIGWPRPMPFTRRAVDLAYNAAGATAIFSFV